MLFKNHKKSFDSRKKRNTHTRGLNRPDKSVPLKKPSRALGSTMKRGKKREKQELLSKEDVGRVCRVRATGVYLSLDPGAVFGAAARYLNFKLETGAKSLTMNSLPARCSFNHASAFECASFQTQFFFLPANEVNLRGRERKKSSLFFFFFSCLHFFLWFLIVLTHSRKNLCHCSEKFAFDINCLF